MRRFVVALCIGIGAWLSGPVFAAEYAPAPMAVYAVNVAADIMDWSSAVLPAAEQTETMVALSTAESTRAALVGRLCCNGSAPVPVESIGLLHLQSLRHYHPIAGRGGLAAHLVGHPNNDGLTG